MLLAVTNAGKSLRLIDWSCRQHVLDAKAQGETSIALKVPTLKRSRNDLEDGAEAGQNTFAREMRSSVPWHSLHHHAWEMVLESPIESPRAGADANNPYRHLHFLGKHLVASVHWHFSC